MTDETGGAIALNTYDEYGVPAAGNLGRYQYTGQFYLPEMGLYDYKARLYSPALGRFMQTDPVGYKDGLNWYDYVHNDPVNGSDPSGNGPPVVRYGLGYASEGVRAGSIDTPYGAPATQGADKASLDAAAKVTTETPLYRIGTANISNAQNAQFWSLHMPDIYTNGHIDEGKVEAYAAKMGIPKENISNASGDLHFLEMGTLKPGTPFITRAAPGIGANAGGGIELVTQPGGVQLRMFNVISTPRMNSGGKSGSALSEVMEIEERAAESPR